MSQAPTATRGGAAPEFRDVVATFKSEDDDERAAVAAACVEAIYVPPPPPPPAAAPGEPTQHPEQQQQQQPTTTAAMTTTAAAAAAVTAPQHQQPQHERLNALQSAASVSTQSWTVTEASRDELDVQMSTPQVDEPPTRVSPRAAPCDVVAAVVSSDDLSASPRSRSSGFVSAPVASQVASAATAAAAAAAAAADDDGDADAVGSLARNERRASGSAAALDARPALGERGARRSSHSLGVAGVAGSAPDPTFSVPVVASRRHQGAAPVTAPVWVPTQQPVTAATVSSLQGRGPFMSAPSHVVGGAGSSGSPTRGRAVHRAALRATQRESAPPVMDERALAEALSASIGPSTVGEDTFDGSGVVVAPMTSSSSATVARASVDSSGTRQQQQQQRPGGESPLRASTLASSGASDRGRRATSAVRPGTRVDDEPASASADAAATPHTRRSASQPHYMSSTRNSNVRSVLSARQLLHASHDIFSASEVPRRLRSVSSSLRRSIEVAAVAENGLGPGAYTPEEAEADMLLSSGHGGTSRDASVLAVTARVRRSSLPQAPRFTYQVSSTPGPGAYGGTTDAAVRRPARVVPDLLRGFGSTQRFAGLAVSPDQLRRPGTRVGYAPMQSDRRHADLFPATSLSRSWAAGFPVRTGTQAQAQKTH